MSQPYPPPQYPGPQYPQYPNGNHPNGPQYPNGQYSGGPQYPNRYGPQYPYGGPAPPPRRPARKSNGTTVAVVAISAVVVVLLAVGLVFAGVAWKVHSLTQAITSGLDSGTGDSGGSSGDGLGDASGGDSGSGSGSDSGDGGTLPDDGGDIVPCSASRQYVSYSQLVNDTYDKYTQKIDAGTIFTDLNLPATQESADYIHDFLIIITDRKSALRFGCENTTDVDDLDDIYEAKTNEVKEYERKLNAHESFDITIRITRSDGSVYESDGGAPPEQTISDVENAIRSVPVTAGGDGTYLSVGENIIKAAGLSANYDFQQIYQYCSRSGSDEYTMAAFCSANPRVIYVNQAHAGYSTNITTPYYADVIKHEMGHALVYQQCGTTRPPVGVNGEALANSYALKYLGGNRDNLQRNIQDFPEYTMSDASDQAAERVHNKQCTG